MKVIFLDFDGVITTLESKWRLCPEKMELVKKICDSTDAKIVISSSWRLSTVERTLKDLGCGDHRIKCPFILANYVVGVTPYHIPYKIIMRGYEIKYYMEQHPEITNYVILDDDTDMLDEQKEHFVNTDTYKGINDNDVNKAIKILNNGKN